MATRDARGAGPAEPDGATATAHPNIALVKYWGKADESLVLPRTSSLSLTIAGLPTATSVRFRDVGGREDARGDSVRIDGREQSGEPARRVSHVLDLVRRMAGIDARADVESRTCVPIAAGLASSAAGFAALAASASRAAGLRLTSRELSRLARRGSGSAARSVIGGFALWHAGSDRASFAEPVPSRVDMSAVVVLVDDSPKPIGSRQAMRATVATSPLYEAWARASAGDLAEALAGLASGDVERVGRAAEANSFGMHAAMLAARPAIVYWREGTLTALRAVRAAREAGLSAWASIDAGPNVVAFAPSAEDRRVADFLRERLPGARVSVHRAGPGVSVRAGADDER